MRPLLLLLLLAAPAAGQQEVWRLVRTESPAIEWKYTDGRFTRDGTTAHYVREPNGERFDLQFTWRVPDELTAGVAEEVSLTADVVAGWECRPFFLQARVFLAQVPCAFCADGREVGAGICNEHAAATRTFRIEPGNFGQAEARLHIQVTDGGQFGGIVATYIYARGSAPPTATATRTPSAPPTPTQTASPRRTPTEPSDDLACGETRHGALTDSDRDVFGDGTRADLYLFTLGQRTMVRFTMDGEGFDPYLWLGDASDPDSYRVIAQETPPLATTLGPGRYVIVANNLSPLASGVYPYSLAMDCGGGATPTRIPSLTASPSPTRTVAPIPTATRVPPTAATGTRTPTPTSALGRTASPTATVAGCVIPSDGGTGTSAGLGTSGCTDLVADAVEITQSIQDLDNSIPLIAGKPTFVRFHVHSTGGPVRATARLRVGTTIDDPLAQELKPINPYGCITVVERPDRTHPDAAFLFELPERFVGDEDGDLIVLEAEVDPLDEVAEPTASNNTFHETEALRFVPPMQVLLYHVGYYDLAAPDALASLHVRAVHDWLAAAYPVAEVEILERSLPTVSGPPPDCPSINWALLKTRLINRHFDRSVPRAALYYAMVYDRGRADNFVQGETFGSPFADSQFIGVSCGPSGNPRNFPRYDWDKDDSYGDWYAGHELGHALGQEHPGVCPDEYIVPWIGPGPHHEGGAIGEFQEGRQAVYGFDARSGEIYSPGVPGFWTDVMTYCSNQWISDLTYNALFGRLRHLREMSAATRLVVPVEDHVLVAGSIDGESGTVTIDPLLTLPNGPDTPPVAGELAIVLRDAGGAELARHPFAAAVPRHDSSGASAFAELVPAVDGTARVDVEGPGVFGTRAAGPSPPQVTVTSPNGGEVLSGNPVSVAWTASDSDGDAMSFTVQYTPDDGASWEVLAVDLDGRAVDLAAMNLAPTESGRFRVWASDGIHSAADVSDGPFQVPNRAPVVAIAAPADGTVIAHGQTLALVGEVTARGGPLRAEQLQWRSDREGVLGSGRRLAIADLGVGEHVVTLRAYDDSGGFGSAEVRVVVVAELADLPRCAGDCSGDGLVTVNELIAGVGVALGMRSLDACAPMDSDGDGAVTIAELVAAVNAALGEC